MANEIALKEPVLHEAPAVFAAFELDHLWRWRSAGGEQHAPEDMETRHLFYTIRMIWNHSVPERMRVGRNVRLYRFPDFYTSDYMKAAVVHLGAELGRRTDLEPWQVRELTEIRSWFENHEWNEVKSLSGPRMLLT